MFFRIIEVVFWFQEWTSINFFQTSLTCQLGRRRLLMTSGTCRKLVHFGCFCLYSLSSTSSPPRSLPNSTSLELVSQYRWGTCLSWNRVRRNALCCLKWISLIRPFYIYISVSVFYLFFFVTYHAVKWGPCMVLTPLSSPFAVEGRIIQLGASHLENWFWPPCLFLISFSPPNFFPAEFSLSFPALAGTLSLAMFIHNGIMAILRNQKKPQNNTRDLSIAYLLVTVTYMWVLFDSRLGYVRARAVVDTELVERGWFQSPHTEWTV